MKQIRKFVVFACDFGSRVVLQAAFFIGVSRLLGAEGFGAFASLTAISTLFSCFSGFSTDQILIRQSGRGDFDLKFELAKCIISTIVTFCPLFIFGLVVCIWTNGQVISWNSIAIVLFSDLLLARSVSIASATLFVMEKNIWQFSVNISQNIFKVFFVVAAYFIVNDASVDDWCFIYALSTFLAGAFSVTICLFHVGKPKFKRFQIEWREGLLYSLEYASLAAFRDIDKPVVNMVLGGNATGSYAAAFRIVDTICVPVRAYLQVTYLQYFRLAGGLVSDLYEYSKKNALYLVLIGLFLAVALLFLAPYTPIILGSEYKKSVNLILIMSSYPIMLALTSMASDILRSMNRQKMRLLMLLVTYIAYIPSIYIGASEFGVSGAAIARMCIQLLTLIITWVAVIWAFKLEMSRQRSFLREDVFLSFQKIYKTRMQRATEEMKRNKVRLHDSGAEAHMALKDLTYQTLSKEPERAVTKSKIDEQNIILLRNGPERYKAGCQQAISFLQEKVKLDELLSSTSSISSVRLNEIHACIESTSLLCAFSSTVKT